MLKKYRLPLLALITGVFTVSCSNSTQSTSAGDSIPHEDTVVHPDSAAKDSSLAAKEPTFAEETTDEESAKTLGAFLRKYLKDDLNTMDTSDRKFSFYKIDLNDDKQEEYFIWLKSPYFCGTGGCTFILLDKDVKFMQRFTVMDPPVFRSSAVTNGWHDLILISTRTPEKTAFKHLKFSAEHKKYPSNPSLVAESDVAPSGSDFIMWDENFSRAKEFKF